MTDAASQVVRLNLTPKEAAAAIGIGITLMRQLIKDGTVPSHRLGRRVLINARELDRWNTEHSDQAEAERAAVRDAAGRRWAS